VHFIVGMLETIGFSHQSLLLLHVSCKGCTLGIDLPLVTHSNLLSLLVFFIDFSFIAGNQVPLPLLVVNLWLLISLPHRHLIGRIHEVRIGLVKISLLVGRWHHPLPRCVRGNSSLDGFEFRLRESWANGIERRSRILPECSTGCLVGIHVRILCAAVGLKGISIHQLIYLNYKGNRGKTAQ
jgi:hypothetical protein